MRQRTHYVPGSVLGDKYMLMSKIWSLPHSEIEILIFKLKITFSKGLSLIVIKCQVPGVHQEETTHQRWDHGRLQGGNDICFEKWSREKNTQNLITDGDTEWGSQSRLQVLKSRRMGSQRCCFTSHDRAF